MKEKEAKIVMFLNLINLENCNIHFVAAKFDLCYTSAFHLIKILVAKNYLKVLKGEKKTLYRPTPEGLELAQKELDKNVSE